MKKLLSIILIIVMCISISSCTFNNSAIINADGKVEIVHKTSLSKTEAETIKETAKSKIGQKVDFGDGEEVFDAQMYGMVVGYVETFIQEAKTEEINGETYYYTLEKETSTLKKINGNDEYDSSKGLITTTDAWIYDKNERIQEDVSMDDFYDSDEIDYISAFGGTFVVENWLKMPYKITKTNFEKVDDYTVDMSKPGDPKFAYVITEKSTADWTKSENIFEEVLKMAKEKFATASLKKPSVEVNGAKSVGVYWSDDWGFDKIEVQSKIGKGKWKTLKTLTWGIGGYVVKDLKPNKTYHFRLRGFVNNKDLGKVYGIASKSVSFDTSVLNAPSVKLVSGEKSFAVKATKKNKGAKGFEIKYSTNKNMKSAKTKTTKKLPVTIKKLSSGKTYYVKVRKILKKNWRGNVCGNWTKVKKVTVK